MNKIIVLMIVYSINNWSSGFEQNNKLTKNR